MKSVEAVEKSLYRRFARTGWFGRVNCGSIDRCQGGHVYHTETGGALRSARCTQPLLIAQVFADPDCRSRSVGFVAWTFATHQRRPRRSYTSLSETGCDN